MARKTIKVDYLARVEGEGGVRITFDDRTVRNVELRIFEPHLASEDAFDRANPGAQGRRVMIHRNLFEPLTTRYATLQDDGVNQRLKDALAARVNFLCTFNLHIGCWVPGVG